MSGYRAALAGLERLEAFGIRLGLENMDAACEALGRPERAFDVVHVAGTNGKGSTAVAVAALASAHGRAVGLYVSPHLVDFRERILVEGEPVDGATVARAWERVRPIVEKRSMTYFEAATLIAFLAFAERELDAAVIEVGLGGRLDATNVVHPRIALVTNVARDHEAHLGEDEATIAGEKAGVMKPGVPALVGDPGPPEVRRVLETTADRVGAPLAFLAEEVEWTVRRTDAEGTTFDYASADRSIEGLVVPAAGAAFATDAALGLRAFERIAGDLGVTVEEDRARRALAGAALPGRAERRRVGGVEVVLDAAHNPAAAGRLAESLRADGGGPAAVVAGILADKAWPAVLDALEPVTARAWLCGLETAPPTRRLSEIAARPGLAARPRVEWAADVATALAAARAAVESGAARRIVVTGSFHTVGEAMVALGLAREGEPARRPAPAGAPR